MKPQTPHIAFFDGWSIFAIIILLAVSVAAYFNIQPVGDMPRSLWWWYIGLAVFLAVIHVARYLQLVRRNTPAWNYPTVRPWSDPLQTVDHEHLDMVTWFAASGGHTIAHAQEQLQDAAMFHYVEDGYEKYLRKYREAYGL